MFVFFLGFEMKIYVYDYDGVLCDSSARYKTRFCPNKGKELIDLDFWISNRHKALECDKLLPLHAEYTEALKSPDTFVIIATARHMVPGDAEYLHIHEVAGKPDALIYRQKPDDNRGWAVLKVAGLRKLLNLRQFKGAEIVVTEDNVDYLKDICMALHSLGYNVTGRFIPSKQGH